VPVIRLEPCGFMQNFEKFYDLLGFLRSKELNFRTGVNGDTPLAWVDAVDIAELVCVLLRQDLQDLYTHIKLVRYSIVGFSLLPP